jgi:hypothetical protein
LLAAAERVSMRDLLAHQERASGRDGRTSREDWGRWASRAPEGDRRGSAGRGVSVA